MRAQRFEIGQAVTLKKNCKWHAHRGSIHGSFPRFGEVYHVYKYLPEAHYLTCIALCELSPKDYFDQDDFEPLISTSELEEALREQPITA